MNRGYTSLSVDVRTLQCVKSFNHAVHSALYGKCVMTKTLCKTSMLQIFSTRFLYTVWYTSTIHIAFRYLNRFFLSFYTTLNFFSVTIRLTDVQRSQVVADAIILGLMCQLLGLRETGRLADRPRSGRPRLTSLHQDRAIRLAHLRYRHLTTTEIALNTVSTHNPSGTFALSSLNYHRNCPQYRKHS